MYKTDAFTHTSKRACLQLAVYRCTRWSGPHDHMRICRSDRSKQNFTSNLKDDPLVKEIPSRKCFFVHLKLEKKDSRFRVRMLYRVYQFICCINIPHRSAKHDRIILEWPSLSLQNLNSMSFRYFHFIMRLHNGDKLFFKVISDAKTADQRTLSSNHRILT